MENKVLKERVDWLQTRLDETLKTVKELEQAIMSSYAPKAYEDLRADKYPDEKVSEEDRAKSRIERDVTLKWLESIEKPLFDRTDPKQFAEELEYALASAAGDIPLKSLDESNPES
jgi:hypothetical protein